MSEESKLNNEVEIQSGAGNLTDAWGFRSDLFVRKNATKLTSIDALLTTGSSTTFNEVYGIRVDPAISSSTTINNTFHLLDLEDTFINSSATLPTDSYSIYSDVSLPSYFKGNIEIGNASNILLDDTTPDDPTILIKLYEPLPSQFNLKTPCWVVQQIANSLAYNISITSTFDTIGDNIYINRPNFNLSVSDNINNSTDYINYTTLTSPTAAAK